MRKYDAAELVELGNSVELVLGGSDEPPDNVSGTSLRDIALYDAAEAIELGEAADLVLGGFDEPPDNVAGSSLKDVAMDAAE